MARIRGLFPSSTVGPRRCSYCANGNVAVWLMNGAQVTQFAGVATVPTVWVDPTAAAIDEVLSWARLAFTGAGPDRRSTSSMKARQQRGDVMNQATSWQPSYSLCHVEHLRESLATQPVIKPSFSSSSTEDLSNILSFRRYGDQ
jgi:hypothetical protein